jgi:hypothetical protein
VLLQRLLLLHRLRQRLVLESRVRGHLALLRIKVRRTALCDSLRDVTQRDA